MGVFFVTREVREISELSEIKEKRNNSQFSILANASKREQRLLADFAEREHFRQNVVLSILHKVLKVLPEGKAAFAFYLVGVLFLLILRD